MYSCCHFDTLQDTTHDRRGASAQVQIYLDHENLSLIYELSIEVLRSESNREVLSTRLQRLETDTLG